MKMMMGANAATMCQARIIIGGSWGINENCYISLKPNQH